MKTSNFKKVLALVLALAMVLSVCTMSFSVSAETETADLSYYVMNDATEDNGWEGHNNVATRVLNGRNVYRVTAINVASAAQFGVKNNIGTLTADDLANVNTVSMYVNNTTGETLQFAYDYYVWTNSDPVLDEEGNPTYNEDGSAIVQYNDWRARLSNGYAYLLDSATGEILPYKTDTGGNVKIPAGFEGYLIYDFSNSANYGNASSNKDGDLGPSIDWIKSKSFQGMNMFVKNTENMLTTPWYFGEVAISNKGVTELANYLYDGIISYNFNTASVYSYSADDALNFWNGNKKFDTDENGRANFVNNVGSFEGVGSKFTVTTLGCGAIGGPLAIRNVFVETKGTGVPFDILNATGIRFDIRIDGNVNFTIDRVNGLSLTKTIHLIGEDGLYVGTNTSIPENFKGIVYMMFDKTSAVNGQTWKEYISSLTSDFNLSGYVAPNSKEELGDSITFGGFGFVYDEDIIFDVENPILADGTRATRKNYGDWDFSYGEKYTAVYNGNSASVTNLLMLDENIAKDLSCIDVSKINGFSFKLKVPDDGYTHGIDVRLGKTYGNQYLGQKIAIDKNGEIVATQNYGWNGPKIKVPSGFDGTIILTDVVPSGNTPYVIGWVGSNPTPYATFGEYYAACGNNLPNFTMQVAKYDSTNKAVAYSVGDTYEYDELRAITQDMDSYIEKVKADYAAEVYAKNNEEYVKNGVVFNAGNTPDSQAMWNNTSSRPIDVTYVENDSDNGYGSKMIFHDWKNNDEEGNGQQRISTKITLPSDADASKAIAVAYTLDVTNPDSKPYSWTYQINAQINALKPSALYFIDDATGSITKDSDNKLARSDEFKGTVIVVFDPEVAVHETWGTKNEWNWNDFVDQKGFTNFCFWAALGTAQDQYEWHYQVDENGDYVLDDEGKKIVVYDTKTIENEDGTTTEKYITKYDNFSAVVDDLTLLYEGCELLEEINTRFDTEKYSNTANSLDEISGNGLSKNNATNATYDVSIDRVDGAPGIGTAYKLTRTANDHIAGQQIFIKGTSSLTKDEVLGLEALAYWIKIPEGKKFMVSKNINAQYNNVVSSILTYNTVTNEYNMLTDEDSLVLTGFEGYVIMPLKNAIVNTKSGSEPKKFSEFYGTYLNPESNLTQLGGYFYINNSWHYTATEVWIGAYQAIPSLTEFFAEIGAETNSGDLNNDTETDVRDLVRLKKFNADPKTALAYQNADVDGNGIFDTAAELINIRKQNTGVEYKATEKDASLVKYPETMVGIYHHTYGDWDSKYADVIAEDDIVNTYITSDYYELKEIAANGDAAWFQLFKSIDGEYVFQKLNDEGKKVYDSDSLVINGAYKDALDAKVQKMKDLGVWNAVIGFHSEEILMGQVMTNEQFALWTKYLSETYGKRFFACLSAYENKGGIWTDKDTKVETTVPRADYETYQYVTDIGFDDYNDLYPDIKSALDGLMTNVALSNDGETVYDRSDMKYWLFPTAFAGCATVDDTLVDEEGNVIKGTTSNGNGKPAADDAKIAAYIADYDLVFSEIPEAQRGGIMFYTWTTWNSSYGLEDLIGDYGYTETCDALIALATKYVD